MPTIVFMGDDRLPDDDQHLAWMKAKLKAYDRELGHARDVVQRLRPLVIATRFVIDNLVKVKE